MPYEASAGDEADTGILPGRSFFGRLSGLAYRYVHADERFSEIALVSLARGIDADARERQLGIPVPALVAALESSGRHVPMQAAEIIRRSHARDRVARSKIARWWRSRAPAPASVLRHLWTESLGGETPEAFLVRHAPPGRPVADALLRRILASSWEIPDHDTLRAALSLPLDWFPDSPEAQRELACLAGGTAAIAGMLGSYDFLLPARGRFGDFRRSLALRLGVPTAFDADPWLTPEDAGRALLRRTLETACIGVTDMFEAFADQIAQPMLFRHGLGGATQPPFRHGCGSLAAARLLAGSKGLVALLDLSDRWHGRIHAIDAVLDPLGCPGGHWSVPFGRVDLGDGIEAVALATPSDLRAEGAPNLSGGLGHCVGTYARSCAIHRCSIVSIRRPGPDGTAGRLSTVELVRNGAAFHVVQHRGSGNGPPPAESGPALDRLLRGLASGEIPVNPDFEKDRARAAKAGYRSVTAATDDASSYWRDAQAVARIHAAWRPLLPTPLRDPADLSAAVRSAAYGIDRDWRSREGRYYAEARFGMLAQGYRPWNGPERPVPGLTRLLVLATAPVFLHQRIEPALRQAAWRLGHASAEPSLGRAGGLASRGLPILLFACAIAAAVLHAWHMIGGPRGSFDSTTLCLLILRDGAVGYLPLCLLSHVAMVLGRRNPFRRSGSDAPLPPSSGAYVRSRP